MENNLQSLISNKKFVVFMVILALLLLVLIPLATRPNISPGRVEPQPTVGQAGDSFNQTDPFEVSKQEQSPEVLQAIEEQRQADMEYDSWQQSNSDNYSWIRKLPLTDNNYFVYFDLTKKVFIGRLYPGSGEDVEATKSLILSRLKSEKEIPIESFRFEWLINP